MLNTRNLILSQPPLFNPSVIRGLNNPGNPLERLTISDIEGNISTSSFRYDQDGKGLRSTQQLNVDWSKFENHVFYNSAQVKVNSTLQNFYNSFPFDGTKQEYETFFDNLDGYSKYFYTLMPKNKSYLVLSGTNPLTEQGTSKGTFVVGIDSQGAQHNNISRGNTGKSFLNPNLNSMTMEFYLSIPPISNSCQVILQKISASNGYSILLNETGSIGEANISMYLGSGSVEISTSFNIPKNKFNHICFVWDRTPGISRLFGVLNGKTITSSSQYEMQNLSIGTNNFYIGSGSQFRTGPLPKATLSGAIDELRVWSSTRTEKQIQEFLNKNVYAQNNLNLYYKFNEASGSQTQMILDHSGNGLHGSLNDYSFNTLNIRNVNTSSYGKVPLNYEQDYINPVLFSEHPDLVSLTQKNLLSASIYDSKNPSWIVNFVPSHLLKSGQYDYALKTEQGTIVEELHSSELGNSQQGETQVFLLLLYMWAKYFDELKLYIDAFVNLNHLDYDQTDTIPDQFLYTIANKFGINLPNLFQGASVQQFINGETIDDTFAVKDSSLQKIQTEVWKRLLINIKDILNSKGTKHSIKSLIRSIGIDPDNNFRIREYGGPSKKTLTNTILNRSEVSTMLNFISGGFVESPFLVATSKKEPGFPLSSSNPQNDLLLTSGSWSCETIYKHNKKFTNNESICRFEITGSAGRNIQTNVLFISGSGLFLYAKPNQNGSTLSMSLNQVNLFDGDVWNVCFQKNRNDPNVSSSYVLMAGKQSYGQITDFYSTQSYFDDNAGFEMSNSWTNKNPVWNASGSLLCIGSSSYSYDTSFLDEQTKTLNGKISQIRFWSKALQEKEFKEHIKNFKSFGINDPSKNFNFVSNITGSWERLRLDVSTDQPLVQTDVSGTILLTDFSQNFKGGISGSLFPATSSIIVPETFYYSYLSPFIDDGSTENKIRIRSLQNWESILNDEELTYTQVAPIYEINKNEQPQDDARLSIDFSIVDALNQDIVLMFSSLEDFNQSIGNPELVFSPDYPRLENLKDIYFNRLTNSIQVKIFFEFYKWFNSAIGNMIYDLIPRKTKFLGINYLVESHLLERHKFQYLYSDVYLGDSIRSGLGGNIYLQSFSGKISKI